MTESELIVACLPDSPFKEKVREHLARFEADQSAILRIIQCPAECEPPSMDQTVLVRGVASLVYRIRELEMK
jgi:hypothetical protein